MVVVIYTQKADSKHSVVQSSDQLTTARNITVTDGTHTSSAVSFNGTTDVSLNLPTHIATSTVQGTAALIMPTASQGPANSLFVAVS